MNKTLDKLNEQGNADAADKLHDFAVKVQDGVEKGIIAPEHGQPLIDDANVIIALLTD